MVTGASDDTVTVPGAVLQPPPPITTLGPPLLKASGVTQRFGAAEVLRDVSFTVRAGQIHALLGPNGAGKTTYVRILAGLLHPTAGEVQVAGYRPSENAQAFRRQVGFVASGDRTFYLRLSGLENLAFFARLHGMRRRDAVRRASELLEAVDLAAHARKPVAEYSHGMQKRLGVARALLASPPVLLVDEATHDLDPEASRRVREMVDREVDGGAAVVWVTQRLEELRGFADVVTVLRAGEVRFRGSVPELMLRAASRRFVVHLLADDPAVPEAALRAALGAGARLSRMPHSGAGHWVLALAEDVTLGEALAPLIAADVQVLSCQEERSELEEAFLALVEEGRP